MEISGDVLKPPRPRCAYSGSGVARPCGVRRPADVTPTLPVANPKTARVRQRATDSVASDFNISVYLTGSVCW